MIDRLFFSSLLGSLVVLAALSFAQWPGSPQAVAKADPSQANRQSARAPAVVQLERVVISAARTQQIAAASGAAATLPQNP